MKFAIGLSILVSIGVKSINAASYEDMGAGSCLDSQGELYDVIQSNTKGTDAATCNSWCQQHPSDYLVGFMVSNLGACYCNFLEGGLVQPVPDYNPIQDKVDLTLVGKGSVAKADGMIASGFHCYKYPTPFVDVGAGSCQSNKNHYYNSITSNSEGTDAASCNSWCQQNPSGQLVGFELVSYSNTCVCDFSLDGIPSPVPPYNPQPDDVVTNSTWGEGWVDNSNGDPIAHCYKYLPPPPNPNPASYVDVGEGYCQDSQGEIYDHIRSDTEGTDATTCNKWCQQHTSHDLVGFELNLLGGCYCDFSDGGIVHPAPLYYPHLDNVNENENGKGSIVSAGDASAWRCYRYDLPTSAPTTHSPTSHSPTSHAPVATAAPTTHMPTSLRPTSHSPTAAVITHAPSTVSPTSHAPVVTAGPTTHAPTSLKPTSHSPTTSAAAVTNKPSTHSPSTVSPTSHAPVATTAPSTHSPTTLRPSSHSPTSQAPVSSAPSAKSSKSAKKSKGGSSKSTKTSKKV